MQRIKLTDRGVAALPLATGGRRTCIGDAIVLGLTLRIGARSKAWTVWKRWGGSRHTAPITLGHWPALTLAEARQRALAAMQSAEDPRPQHRQRRSPAVTSAAQAALFAHAAQRYLSEVVSRQDLVVKI